MYYEISFPSLGLRIDPSPTAFTVFGLEIKWYGIIIALGFILAVLYCSKRAGEFGLTADQIIDVLIFAIPAAIIGARLYFCVFNWSLFADNPIRILYIRQGGLAIYGGIIGAVIAAVLVCGHKKLKATAFMDIGAFGLMIGQAVGRWGNFFNREAFGVETEGFFRMGLTDAFGNTIFVHPTFLYESLWNITGFILLHIYSKKARRRFDSEFFLLYVAWYGLGRGFIEGLRTDSLFLAGTGLRISQLLGFASMAVAVVILVYNLAVKKHSSEELFVNRVGKAASSAEEHTQGEKADESDDN